MKTAEIAASALSLLATILLTWPALRVGRMLNQAVKMGQGAERAIDPVSANIFRRFQSGVCVGYLAAGGSAITVARVERCHSGRSSRHLFQSDGALKSQRDQLRARGERLAR
jgi:hypothetical protein